MGYKKFFEKEWDGKGIDDCVKAWVTSVENFEESAIDPENIFVGTLIMKEEAGREMYDIEFEYDARTGKTDFAYFDNKNREVEPPLEVKRMIMDKAFNRDIRDALAEYDRENGINRAPIEKPKEVVDNRTLAEKMGWTMFEDKLKEMGFENVEHGYALINVLSEMKVDFQLVHPDVISVEKIKDGVKCHLEKGGYCDLNVVVKPSDKVSAFNVANSLVHIADGYSAYSTDNHDEFDTTIEVYFNGREGFEDLADRFGLKTVDDAKEVVAFMNAMKIDVHSVDKIECDNGTLIAERNGATIEVDIQETGKSMKDREYAVAGELYAFCNDTSDMPYEHAKEMLNGGFKQEMGVRDNGLALSNEWKPVRNTKRDER